MVTFNVLHLFLFSKSSFFAIVAIFQLIINSSTRNILQAFCAECGIRKIERFAILVFFLPETYNCNTTNNPIACKITNFVYFPTYNMHSGTMNYIRQTTNLQKRLINLISESRTGVSCCNFLEHLLPNSARTIIIERNLSLKLTRFRINRS